MEIKDLDSITAHLIQIQAPWYISKIDLQKSNKVIDISVDFIKGSKFCCKDCNSSCSAYDKVERRWRYLDWFEHRCYLNIKIPRTDCVSCGVKIVSSIPWGRLGSHYSYFFEEKILRLSREMTMSGLSKELGEPDNNLWRVFHHYVHKAVDEQLNLKEVRRIAVDEKSQKKGHIYVTIFTDLDTGNVILVKEGRKKEVFLELKKWLIKKHGLSENIELFSMDLSVSYKAGQKEYFEKSEVVFDRFHIKKALNEAVDTVRKQEVAYSSELKKTKYIWLKNPVNLTERQEEKLNDFLRESTLETAIAYQLKTAFDQLWQVQPKAAEPLLKVWLENAVKPGLKPIIKFVNTVKENLRGIVKSIQTGITNAIAEGINSKIQMAKARARGFRNMDNFISMIYFLGNNDFTYNTH